MSLSHLQGLFRHLSRTVTAWLQRALISRVTLHLPAYSNVGAVGELCFCFLSYYPLRPALTPICLPTPIANGDYCNWNSFGCYRYALELDGGEKAGLGWAYGLGKREELG